MEDWEYIADKIQDEEDSIRATRFMESSLHEIYFYALDIGAVLFLVLGILSILRFVWNLIVYLWIRNRNVYQDKRKIKVY
jgi:hypothetical protein